MHMVILLTVIILLAFVFILITTFTYVVTYSSNSKIAEEYLNENDREPLEEFIEDHSKFVKEARKNPFITEMPDLDRDDLINFMERDVMEKRAEASRKAKVASETTSITTQLEEIFAEESLAS